MIQGTRVIGKLDVVLFVFSDVTSNALADLVWVAVVGEVGMVRDDKDGVFHALQEVIPVLESMDHRQKLAVVDGVALLGSRECLGVVSIGSEDRFAFPICHVLVCLV